MVCLQIVLENLDAMYRLIVEGLREGVAANVKQPLLTLATSNVQTLKRLGGRKFCILPTIKEEVET